MTLITALLLSLAPEAHAYVDPKCEGETQKFDDLGQQNFMLNYFSLATSYSPIHSPVPLKPGHGSVSVEMSIIPPLSCAQRLVLDSSKTEDTNKAPILPRPRVLFAFPKQGNVVPYAGFGIIPPITVFGVRNLLLSTEMGVGLRAGEWEYGGRVHASMIKTVGEIATPFVEGDPAYDDLYVGSTVGLDLMLGYKFENSITPYLALGLTDVSTFFYITDDGYVGNNFDPFFGPTMSLGLDGDVGNWNFGGEFYTAPGMTYSRAGLSEDISDYDGWHTVKGGFIYTGRFRVSYVM